MCVFVCVSVSSMLKVLCIIVFLRPAYFKGNCYQDKDGFLYFCCVLCFSIAVLRVAMCSCVSLVLRHIAYYLEGNTKGRCVYVFLHFSVVATPGCC